MFYSHTLLGMTALGAWVHNLVSNASASGVTITGASLVARVIVQQGTNTMTGFPIITGLLSNTITLALSVNAHDLVTCRVEVQFMHSIPT